MKRQALNHTKTDLLMRLLGIERWGAVGILESLWHLTSKEAPAGDIGKLTDERIAIGIDWRPPSNRNRQREATKLVRALTEAGWLDTDPTYRLIVHDWHEHADDAVRKYVKRNKLKWACRDMSRQVETNPDMSRLPVPEPVPVPEPEPAPEPGGESKTGERTRTPICIDDRFSEFRARAEELGVSGSEPDWQDAKFEWGRLDFHGKEAAMLGLSDRITAGARDDPAAKALPKNYLRKRMWQRAIRLPDSKHAGTMEIFDRRILEEGTSAKMLT